MAPASLSGVQKRVVVDKIDVSVNDSSTYCCTVEHMSDASSPDVMVVDPLADAQPAGGALVGYARATGGAGDLTERARELTQAGCGRVYTDEQTGGQNGRPRLAACLTSLRPGDTLVVASLDQLGRSQ